MATTKSKTTVNTNVIKSTKISNNFFVFRIDTNLRHSLILYATIKSIAAITGIGINAAYGIKTSKTKKS